MLKSMFSSFFCNKNLHTNVTSCKMAHFMPPCWRFLTLDLWFGSRRKGKSSLISRWDSVGSLTQLLTLQHEESELSALMLLEIMSRLHIQRPSQYYWLSDQCGAETQLTSCTHFESTENSSCRLPLFPRITELKYFSKTGMNGIISFTPVETM